MSKLRIVGAFALGLMSGPASAATVYALTINIPNPQPFFSSPEYAAANNDLIRDFSLNGPTTVRALLEYKDSAVWRSVSATSAKVWVNDIQIGDQAHSFGSTYLQSAGLCCTLYFGAGASAPYSPSPDGRVQVSFNSYFSNLSLERGHPLPLDRALLIGATTSLAVYSSYGFITGFGSIQDVTISGNPLVASIPEPTSWVMLFLGFGVVGGSLRFSRVRSRMVVSSC
jgi:hypothetical protein